MFVRLIEWKIVMDFFFLSSFFFFEKRGRGEECEVNICIFANFFLYSYFHFHLNVKLR